MKCTKKKKWHFECMNWQKSSWRKQHLNADVWRQLITDRPARFMSSWYVILCRRKSSDGRYDSCYYHHTLNWIELKTIWDIHRCVLGSTISPKSCVNWQPTTSQTNTTTPSSLTWKWKVHCGHQIRGKSLTMNAQGKLKCTVLNSRSTRQGNW
jgi:hypothetical protein